MVGDNYELMLVEVEAERTLRLKDDETAISIEAQVRQLDPTMIRVAQQLSATQLYQERKRWESAQNPSEAIRLGHK